MQGRCGTEFYPIFNDDEMTYIGPVAPQLQGWWASQTSPHWLLTD